MIELVVFFSFLYIGFMLGGFGGSILALVMVLVLALDQS